MIDMSRGSPRLELHARSGRAVLVRPGDSEPCDLPLPDGLEPALHEWARIADVVCRGGDDGEPAALVSRRGRQLAAQLARSTGAPVGYADPIGGTVELLDPTPEPTPWATGLTISAASAAIVGVALLALSRGLAGNGGWVVLLANLLFAAGLAPSIWLGRATPIWRWVAYGAAGGILLTWLALLLSLLG